MSTPDRRRHGAGKLALLICLAICGCGQPVSAPAADGDRRYDVVFRVDFTAAGDAHNAAITVGKGAERLRELSFDFEPDRFMHFEADGELDVDGGSLSWKPPAKGGSLRWHAVIENQRRGDGFDARVTDDWALFRGNDIFPAAATRVLVDSVSNARLEFELPKGWSIVTRYLANDDGVTFPIDNEGRSFARPSGWMLAGKIGVRFDDIGETRVSIAAPVGENFRRMDIMAFLNWTLPSLVDIFPTMDERLLIVGGNDPMWRGGLSGPGSLYVHADRPLISENGTSTFLHELVHVAMGVAGSEHDDWIVEGLAEYYSIKILRSSGTMSQRRMELALQDLIDWGRGVDDLFVRRASGEITARATVLLAELDRDLVRLSPDDQGLDAVVGRMIRQGDPYDYPSLCRAAEAVAGKRSRLLDPDRVPGAPAIGACESDLSE